MSEKTFYGCVNGFNNEKNIIFWQQAIRETIFCCNKNKHVLTREHKKMMDDFMYEKK